jgi:hypothetical protein
MNAQIYCTLNELISDLHLNGNEPGLIDRIRAASRFIERRFGSFIPTSEARSFKYTEKCNLFVDPLLAVTGLLFNGQVLTNADYELNPSGRYWRNGPYTRLEKENGTWWDDVEITGRWGMYEEAEGLGLTGTQTNVATTLTVTDGSVLSPGMVIRLDTEQELITGWGAATPAVSLIDGDIDAGQEEITIDNGSEFHEKEVIQFSTEDCFIRMVRGDVLVTTRGWNGTTKAAHLDGDAISVYRTVTVQRGANGTIPAAHNNVAIYQYVVPEDVNWLCRQIAGLMRMKAASGFAGKTGNAELGETFYFNEFPSQVKELKKNYRITTL